MVKSIVNKRTQFAVGVKQSSNAIFHDCIRRFFESVQKKCCELSLVNSESINNKQKNDNKVDSPLSWIIASLGQVAHFTSVVIRNVLATSGWVRSAHTAPYAKSAHNSLVKAIAFTLAETLVVMGIIGVVAALTIPNLNQSTGDREKVAKVKKLYSNLEDAFGRAVAVYGPYDTWLNGLSEDEEKITRIGQRIAEFMKVSKDCGYVDDSNNNTCIRNTGYSIISADGTGIAIYSQGLLFVDIDGPNKGKNQGGHDIFAFDLTNEGVIPLKDTASDSMPLGSCGGSAGSTGCTAWVIEMGNMDYLKLNDNKCPNGKELDWTTNTSCK